NSLHARRFAAAKSLPATQFSSPFPPPLASPRSSSAPRNQKFPSTTSSRSKRRQCRSQPRTTPIECRPSHGRRLAPSHTGRREPRRSAGKRIITMSNIFGKKGKSFGGPDSPHSRAARVRFKSASLNCVDSPKKQNDDTCKYRVFVGTWNVGGKNPNDGLNLQDFLQVDESSDIYVLGFQEIVPLTAGNVLVLEDNEPAARWLALIHQALNHPQEQPDSDEPPEPGPADAGRQQNRRRDAVATRSSSGNLFFQTPSLKLVSSSYRVDSA
uniref:Inositol polyphosphate-related phosphatase domain-containing protein n=1 Tax=Aegilops tauschii subsp. strangulata TaxID=200361 RepID=A0A453R5E9_AEGTS